MKLLNSKGDSFKMNIGIIGAGSIGLLFGAYLSKMNHTVTLYTRSVEQSSILNKEGVLVEYAASSSSSPVRSICIKNGLLTHDVIIIAVKQYHLPTILDELNSIEVTTPLLFIQNGMGHVDLLKDLPHQQILVGVVEHGALKKNDFTVIHSGIGVTKISVFRGDYTILHSLLWSDATPQFPFQLCEDWYEMLLSKLVVNSMINPLTALFGVENGQLLSNPYFFKLFQQLFGEINSLLQPGDPEIWWNSVISICERTAENRSSMLRDLEQKRPTEIEGIIGFLRSLPAYSHKNQPVINFLYTGIKGLEGQRRR
ncbi:2-dehydropantoate 2-reductase [Bacillus sp. DJP31]|uniref:2-dehydropantoate 2-reductase n=1 Tax=Bacillus sp. DJP31 TaxID=3409789 RepID=UPI003BB5667D